MDTREYWNIFGAKSNLRKSPVPKECNKPLDRGKDTGKREVLKMCLTSPSEEVIDGKRKSNNRKKEGEQEMS